jgi:hypothetical protein
MYLSVYDSSSFKKSMAFLYPKLPHAMGCMTQSLLRQEHLLRTLLQNLWSCRHLMLWSLVSSLMRYFIVSFIVLITFVVFIIVVWCSCRSYLGLVDLFVCWQSWSFRSLSCSPSESCYILHMIVVYVDDFIVADRSNQNHILTRTDNGTYTKILESERWRNSDTIPCSLLFTHCV